MNQTTNLVAVVVAVLLVGRSAVAWPPVTDLARRHADSKARKNKYAGEIERVCGGPPGAAGKRACSPEQEAAGKGSESQPQGQDRPMRRRTA
jgi:hypothetical protein